jgi:hypothetical protein
MASLERRGAGEMLAVDRATKAGYGGSGQQENHACHRAVWGIQWPDPKHAAIMDGRHASDRACCSVASPPRHGRQNSR